MLCANPGCRTEAHRLDRSWVQVAQQDIVTREDYQVTLAAVVRTPFATTTCSLRCALTVLADGVVTAQKASGHRHARDGWTADARDEVMSVALELIAAGSNEGRSEDATARLRAALAAEEGSNGDDGHGDDRYDDVPDDGHLTEGAGSERAGD